MELTDYWKIVEDYNSENFTDYYFPTFSLEQDLGKITPLSVLTLSKKFIPLKTEGVFPIIIEQETGKTSLPAIKWLVWATKDSLGQFGLFLSPFIEGKTFAFNKEQTETILSYLKECKYEEYIDKLSVLLEQNLTIGFFWNVMNLFNQLKENSLSIFAIDYVNKSFDNIIKTLEQQKESLKTKENKDKITNFLNKNITNAEKITEEVANDKNIPDEIQKILIKELKKLEYMNPASPDYSHQLSYVETVRDFPFGKETHQNINPKILLEKLNEKHYGLQQVKNSIVEHIALQNWANSNFGEVICLLGPPGVGKSSIANVIADELNRKYIKMALGGLSDESEFRGHRRTYLGSEPGRLVKEFIKIQTIDPLIVFDEIDKLSSFRGSPADALLEILDPEQNTHFVDRYLGFGIDISKSLFICTANYEEQIPAPLKDRMNLIKIPGYSQEEQLKIAKEYLIPKYKTLWNLNNVNIEENALIQFTTSKLTGIRNIEKAIRYMFKKSCFLIQSSDLSEFVIDKNNINEVIDMNLFKAQETKQIGYR